MNYIAYAVTAASIVGTVANSFQKRWCFWVWICTNTFWCVFNVLSGSYAQAVLYAFNFAMAVVGLVKWKRKEPIKPKSFRWPKLEEVKAEKHNTCDMCKFYNEKLYLHSENGTFYLLCHECHVQRHKQLGEKELRRLSDKNSWIKCNAPLGHIEKNCIGRKTIFDCEACKYGKIYTQETEG